MIITVLLFIMGAVCGGIFAPKAVTSLRNRGFRLTWRLFLIKLTSILELWIPKTLWGDGIGLRPVNSSLTDAEIEQVYQWSRNPDLVRSWGGAPTQLSLDEFRKQVRRERWHLLFTQRSFYIITCAGQLIGRIRLYSIDWTKGEGEMGIFLDPNYWGRHYGRAALNLLVHYCFTQVPIKRIYLVVFRENLRAQHAFAACGFRPTGVIKRYYASLGQERENIQMEITRQAFQERQTATPRLEEN